LIEEKKSDWQKKRHTVRCPLGLKWYLRRQSVRVVDPDRWLSPLTVLPSPPGLRGQKGVDEPGRSRLMSQKGSIVVETPLEKEKRVRL